MNTVCIASGFTAAETGASEDTVCTHKVTRQFSSKTETPHPCRILFVQCHSSPTARVLNFQRRLRQPYIPMMGLRSLSLCWNKPISPTIPNRISCGIVSQQQRDRLQQGLVFQLWLPKPNKDLSRHNWSGNQFHKKLSMQQN